MDPNHSVKAVAESVSVPAAGAKPLSQEGPPSPNTPSPSKSTLLWTRQPLPDPQPIPLSIQDASASLIMAADAASSPSLASALTEHALSSSQEALALASTQDAASVHRCAGFAFAVLALELLHFQQDVPSVLHKSEVSHGGDTTG